MHAAGFASRPTLALDYVIITGVSAHWSTDGGGAGSFQIPRQDQRPLDWANGPFGLRMIMNTSDYS